MLIRKFDFLSSPPQMYFLQKKANKKLFGGILFIIYFIIMLIVTIFYILDFYLNDRYDIKYTFYKNFTNYEGDYNKNAELNQNLNFTISLTKYTENFSEIDIDDDLYIIEEDFSIIETNKTFSRNPLNLTLILAYVCIIDCDLPKNESEGLFYLLNNSYSGYKIEHHNKNIPLEKNSDKYRFYETFYLSPNKTTLYDINWGYIKYKEERGLLGLFDNFAKNKKEYSSIDIDNIDKINLDTFLKSDKGFINLKLLAFISMSNDRHHYIQYIRTKKSILDIFANIGALFSSIFTIFSYIFEFYSKNFDNYKIIKSILSGPKILPLNSDIKLFKSKTITFVNIHTKNKNIIKNDNLSFDTSKSVPFKSKGFNIQQKDNDKNKFNFKYNFDLIEINFIQFLFNHFYFKRKHRRKEQKVIDICNNIISKYISIDLILYNQIILESLIKDYKWNDNQLKIIWNNSLIKQLNLNI